jgi:hypothetical protein
MHLFLVQSLDPQSYGEATGNPFWEFTMQEEYNSFLENQTWDLVPLPSGRKIIRCRWVYRTKSIVDGQINRYKARLVTKGSVCMQLQRYMGDTFLELETTLNDEKV